MFVPVLAGLGALALMGNPRRRRRARRRNPVGRILYQTAHHYVVAAADPKKGFEVYRNEGVAAVRCGIIGHGPAPSLGLTRAIAEADRREAKMKSNPPSHWWYLEVRYDRDGEPTKSWHQTNHAVIAESAPEKATKSKRWKRGRAVDPSRVARDIEIAGARRNPATPVNAHIYYDRKRGQAKTVCTSHVLAAFGICSSSYHYSGQFAQRAAILRRNGYAVRSRMSKMGKRKTVGVARTRIPTMGDPPGTRYELVLVYGDSRHAILLDQQGETIVDTDPREADRRRVVAIHAIYPKSAEATNPRHKRRRS